MPKSHFPYEGDQVAFIEACYAAWKLGAVPQPVSSRLPLAEGVKFSENNSPLAVGDGPETLVVHQSDAVLEGMDNWNKSTHAKSGLIDKVKASTLEERAVEMRMLDFLKLHVPKGGSPMCGNSICQDRRFMHRLMPRLERYFHYRNLDVSTIKELARRWAPNIAKSFGKESAHTALSDIRDSISELRHYRGFMGELGGSVRV